jgi:hypothetical protein
MTGIDPAHPRPSHGSLGSPDPPDGTDISNAPPGSPRPTGATTGLDLATATTVVSAFVADLQEGWDSRDAAIADRRLAADVAWGSPYGATVNDFDTLYAIHKQLKSKGTGGPHSRYQIERVLPVSDDVIVAHVARLAVDPHGEPLEATGHTDGAFSEMALYVLVRRDDTWWVAAGHNTPIRPGGAA